MFTPLDDKKFYIEKPDPGFSPARNKAVIDRTIRKYNAMREKKKHEYDDAYAQRADAVVSYLKSFNKPGSHRLDHYFNPKYLAFLRGDDIRRELLARARILDKNGNEITKKDFII